MKHENLVLSNELISLETSAFQIFQDGNSTFISSFDKTKFSYLKFNSFKQKLKTLINFIDSLR